VTPVSESKLLKTVLLKQDFYGWAAFPKTQSIAQKHWRMEVK